MHRCQGIGYFRRYPAGHESGVLLIGCRSPYPSIAKRLDLSSIRGPGVAMIAEQHIVIAVRIERRVQIHEVDRLGGYVLSQHVEVVAVVQPVPSRRRSRRLAATVATVRDAQTVRTQADPRPSRGSWV